MSETAERKAYRAKWYQQNKARINQKDRVKYKLETGKSVTQKEQDLLIPKIYEPSNLVEHKPKQTKEEQLEWVRKYRKLPENIEKTKLYQQKNREKLNKKAREYRQKNRDYYNTKERERNKSPESIAYRKAYYLKTKGAI